MLDSFHCDIFLSHNSADKPRVRRLAERLRAADLRAWFDEWICPSPAGAGEGGRRPGEGRGAKGGSPRPSNGRGVRGEGLAIERALEASRTMACPAAASPPRGSGCAGAPQRRRTCLAEASRRRRMLYLSPAALGSDWVGLERSTVLFRAPPNRGRRFVPLLLA